MLAFFLTLGVAFLAMRKIRWTDYLDMFLRALASGICSAILYLLVSLACIALRLQSAAFFININRISAIEPIVQTVKYIS